MMSTDIASMEKMSISVAMLVLYPGNSVGISAKTIKARMT
jgi:hypothetical protein